MNRNYGNNSRYSNNFSYGQNALQPIYPVAGIPVADKYAITRLKREVSFTVHLELSILPSQVSTVDLAAELYKDDYFNQLIAMSRTVFCKYIRIIAKPYKESSGVQYALSVSEKDIGGIQNLKEEKHTLYKKAPEEINYSFETYAKKVETKGQQLDLKRKLYLSNLDAERVVKVLVGIEFACIFAFDN